MSKLSDIRREFSGNRLEEANMPKEPLDFFKTWLDAALGAGISDANAFVLSSVNEQNQPQARILLLKEYSEAGFIFYTNFNSDKGQELAHNPKASMLFFWKDLFRQVKINGQVEKVSQQQAEEYFATRPRDSKIGALASKQSSKISGEELQANFAKLDEQYKGEDNIPKPENWGGYLLKPTYFEFWQGQASRFHDRICYEKPQPTATDWQIYRRAP